MNRADSCVAEFLRDGDPRSATGCRNRAAEMRDEADLTANQKTKKILLDLAADYERLANTIAAKCGRRK